MKKKYKYRYILFLAIVISFSCALYLNGQLDGNTMQINSVSSSLANLAPEEELRFPEVEMLKVVVEKLINVITMASA